MQASHPVTLVGYRARQGAHPGATTSGGVTGGQRDGSGCQNGLLVCTAHQELAQPHDCTTHEDHVSPGRPPHVGVGLGCLQHRAPRGSGTVTMGATGTVTPACPRHGTGTPWPRTWGRAATTGTQLPRSRRMWRRPRG